MEDEDEDEEDDDYDDGCSTKSILSTTAAAETAAKLEFKAREI